MTGSFFVDGPTSTFWTFILSSQWVEIVKDAGEKANLQQSEEMINYNFWKGVAGQQWRAIIIRVESIFYTPWCSARHGAAPCHA